MSPVENLKTMKHFKTLYNGESFIKYLKLVGIILKLGIKILGIKY